MNQIITCIDGKVDVFFTGNGTLLQKFCSIVTNNKVDQRIQAKRQFAALLASLCAGELRLTPPNGNQIYLDLNTPISCSGLGSTTLGSLIDEVDERLLTLESLSLRNALVKQEYSAIIACLDAINNGRIADSSCPSGNSATLSLEGHSMDPSVWGNEGGSTLEGEFVGETVELYRAWPNPFSQSTRFAYLVAGEGETVEIGVFDAAGRRITSLVSGLQPAGRHEVVWNGMADDGSRVRHGVYFVRIVLAGVHRNMRLIYLQ